MKRLILVRHGKAEDLVSGISDYERSLTPKGKITSRLMARKLKVSEKTGVRIITSHAFRAYETALIFAGELGIDPGKIIINSDIYFRLNLKNLPSIISAAGEDCDTIIMFGHNPSFTEIADSLSDQGCDFMPKSAIVCISFNIKSWTGIKHNAGKMEYHLKPESIL